MGVVHNYSNKIKNNKKYISGKGLVNVIHKKHIYGKGLVDMPPRGIANLNLTNVPTIAEVQSIANKVTELKNSIDELKAKKLSKIKKDIKTGNGFKYI